MGPVAYPAIQKPSQIELFQRRPYSAIAYHKVDKLFDIYYLFWLFRVLSGRRSQIEFPTVEVDGVDEVLLIAETARRGLDPLNP